MDPLLPTERDREAGKERRTIQFSVPSAVPTQLDPGQVEMIRRRRPTPATLFRLTEQPSPEDDGTPKWVHGENGALKAKRVNASVYQPPSLKGRSNVHLCVCVCRRYQSNQRPVGDDGHRVKGLL
ncbi:protein phosphatase 1 regulatory subunit 1B-like [Aplochiton taeniatus]